MGHIGKHRSLVKRGWIVCAAAFCALPLITQAAPCRQALAIGLDVSGSVDAREYQLQVQGLAAALNAPDVRQLLFSMPEAPITLGVFEWSGSQDQHILLPWTILDSPDTLASATTRIRLGMRQAASRTTALGSAMIFAGQWGRPLRHCWTFTVDLTGDGISNEGPRPRDARDAAALTGVGINGLVIGADAPTFGDRRQSDIAELSAYFRAEVIKGPGAFVETALGFENFEQAMTRKLLKELEGLNLSGLHTDQ